jgi:hypothetical protein
MGVIDMTCPPTSLEWLEWLEVKLLVWLEVWSGQREVTASLAGWTAPLVENLLSRVGPSMSLPGLEISMEHGSRGRFILTGLTAPWAP